MRGHIIEITGEGKSKVLEDEEGCKRGGKEIAEGEEKVNHKGKRKENNKLLTKTVFIGEKIKSKLETLKMLDFITIVKRGPSLGLTLDLS